MIFSLASYNEVAKIDHPLINCMKSVTEKVAPSNFLPASQKRLRNLNYNFTRLFNISTYVYMRNKI